jgi:hypothetical protein
VLRFGISYVQFSEICKQAFVDAATEDYGLRSRPTNISRVAVITGLSRKEVARIRGSGDDLARRVSKETAAGDVLHYWHTCTNYLDERLEPVSLRYSGNGICFVNLVREVAGDIPPGAMRVELLRSGAVIECSDGSLRAVQRHFVPHDGDARLIDGLHYGVRTVMGTVAFNGEPANQDAPRFQRVVHYGGISRVRAEVLRSELEHQLVNMTHELDDQVSKVAVECAGYQGSTVRVGVGLYYFEESNDF